MGSQKTDYMQWVRSQQKIIQLTTFYFPLKHWEKMKDKTYNETQKESRILSKGEI